MAWGLLFWRCGYRVWRSRNRRRPTRVREAVQLLEQAKQLEAAGAAAEACRKYGESYSLDAQLDALLPWASCLEQSGKLASAYAAFHDAVAVAERAGDQRSLVANERANQLRPRLSYLTIEVAEARRLPAISVERDGFRVGSSGWGVPFAVDPGSHVIVVKAYGYRDWQTTVDVEGDAVAPYVEVPPLEKAEESPAPIAPEPAPAPSLVAPPPVVQPAPARAALTPVKRHLCGVAADPRRRVGCRRCGGRQCRPRRVFFEQDARHARRTRRHLPDQQKLRTGHQRASGRFDQPRDQQPTRRDRFVRSNGRGRRARRYAVGRRGPPTHG